MAALARLSPTSISRPRVSRFGAFRRPISASVSCSETGLLILCAILYGGILIEKDFFFWFQVSVLYPTIRRFS